MDEDRLWHGGPVLLQPESVKLTTDTVLLADFAEVRNGQKGADLGCSSGALMILLIPYIMHYYFLENSVQKMYRLYDEINSRTARTPSAEDAGFPKGRE